MIPTGAWAWRILGILVGTATVISLVKNGYAIELYGLPAAIFRQYSWLRDMLFEPVAWVLRYFGLTLPWWLKDATMAYGLVAAAWWRAFGRVAMSVFWPITLVRLWVPLLRVRMTFRRIQRSSTRRQRKVLVDVDRERRELDRQSRSLDSISATIASLESTIAAIESQALSPQGKEEIDSFRRQLDELKRVRDETSQNQDEVEKILDARKKEADAKDIGSPSLVAALAASQSERLQIMELVAQQLVVISIFAVAFFLWNYSQSISGPSG